MFYSFSCVYTGSLSDAHYKASHTALVITPHNCKGQSNRKHSSSRLPPLNTATLRASLLSLRVRKRYRKYALGKWRTYWWVYLFCWHFELHKLSLATQHMPRSMDLQKAHSRNLTLKHKQSLDIWTLFSVYTLHTTTVNSEFGFVGIWEQCHFSSNSCHVSYCCIWDCLCSLHYYVKSLLHCQTHFTPFSSAHWPVWIQRYITANSN